MVAASLGGASRPSLTVSSQINGKVNGEAVQWEIWAASSCLPLPDLLPGPARLS
jgi:hypothetical protein